MRKLLLITAMVLTSATAHAGGATRGLMLASSNQPAEVQIQPPPAQTSSQPAPGQAQSQPAPAQAEMQAQPQLQPVAAPAQPPAPTGPAQAVAAKPATTMQSPASEQKPRKVANKREGDEAKARRIAARYGVYW